MFIRNKVLNFYLLTQIKLYKIIKLLSPYLGKVIEENIQKNARYNFIDILDKIKNQNINNKNKNID